MIQKIEIIDFLKRNNLNLKTIVFISDIILKNYEDKDLVPSEKIEAISNILRTKDIGEEFIPVFFEDWDKLITSYGFN